MALKVIPDCFELSLQKNYLYNFLRAVELRKAATAGDMYEHQFIPLTHTKFLGVSQTSLSFIHQHNSWSQACLVHNCRLSCTDSIPEMATKVPLTKEITCSAYISFSVYAASVSTIDQSWMDLSKWSFGSFQLR